MKIEVHPGEVQIAKISVRQHQGAVFTIQIETPLDKHPACKYGALTEPGFEVAQYVDLYSQPDVVMRRRWFGRKSHQPTRIIFRAENNEDGDALREGLFGLDAWARFSVLLIAIPAQYLEEAENAGEWSATSVGDGNPVVA